VLVQTDRDQLLRPTEELRTQVLWMGGIVVTVVLALSSGLWGWLFWSLRMKEQGGHG
jgi:hypothetical protein